MYTEEEGKLKTINTRDKWEKDWIKKHKKEENKWVKDKKGIKKKISKFGGKRKEKGREKQKKIGENGI